MTVSDRLSGLIAATFTPMHQDGSLNLKQVPLIVEHLIREEISGMYVCGSTGEGPSLTTEERCETVEAYVNASSGRIPVITQVGHDSLQEAKKLAGHSAQVGVDAIAALPPSYFKCGSLEVLIECLAEIAGVCPSLPFFYYHIPALTGCDLDMIEFLQRAPERIPNLAGIKYSAPTLHEFQGCVRFARGRFDVLFGVDEMMLGALAMGAKGAIGSTYNFAAPIYRQVVRTYGQGDLERAREFQGVAGDMIRVLARFGGQPAIKSMMKFLGIDCGPSRLPLVALSDSELSELRKAMDAIGLFEFLKPGAHAANL
ncbi:MAG: dihydrodipicolinate synthase family protein [Limnochordia bacterium]|nr:dihydrodipicolinate synthase family protein [Limnochordia bacterium]MDD2630276.1 dihydrodipicolinate synthase family protein [Limnochordia bacterium]MDD4518096.1 dihydrodipicolinate synthase family protein [Limnochordia bacterium]